jgi:hypothetical protein
MHGLMQFFISARLWSFFETIIFCFPSMLFVFGINGIIAAFTFISTCSGTFKSF